MDHAMTTAIVSILTAVVSVALLATFLSKNSDTRGIITAGSQGFSQILGTALSPVTGGGFGFSGNTSNININSGMFQ